MKGSIETRLLINNELVPASDKGTFDLFSPHTGDLVAKVAEATLDDVNRAVSAAQEAFPAWSSLSPAERGKPLKKMADLVLSEKDKLAQLDAISMGRPVSTFFDSNYAATHFNYFAEAAYPQGHTSLNTPGFLNMSLRQPFGVVAIIIPFNAPLVFFSKKVAPAVAAGNCVVVKTSEKAPLTSWKISEWIAKCGFPPGVVNVLSGHGNVGAALAEHMQVRALSFTGSARTGRSIQIASAKSNLKKVVFELGGKGPALVFQDADIEQAAKETENSINWNSGQTCMANSRIYVHESIKDQFISAFTKLARSRKLGDPTLSDTNQGPQADKMQHETVNKYIALGKTEAGSTIDTAASTSGTSTTSETSLLVSPVIFTDVPEGSRIIKEEIFGPVVIINTFSSEAEAISKANDTEFGLYAALYTKDLERAIRVGKKLESGMVGVNCTSPTGCWDLPFGGWKGSGTGRESLLESMEHYLEMVNYHFAPRGSFAVILPSTNVAVEAEYGQMMVPGISWHSGRIMIRDPNLGSDEAFEQFMVDLRKEIGNAVDSVMTAQPDYMVMGMSSETFWGGKAGAAKFEGLMKELSGGLDITTGAQACNAALEKLGAKRIGVITPYQTVGDDQVRAYLTEVGFDVAGVHGLKCPTAKSIADVQPETLKEAFRKVDGPDVQALIQAGTNLFCAKVAAEMEEELGKPVIAINTATVWHAYRTHGIQDQIKGFGCLLEKY
ncbi:Aldedh-domain-containing protein [Polyplosphaeria fusca]|uniref:aldehyde dehydrogenase (NAD(+)) n=1 Tax=Polyplosphaeria fusca TaxID=682080 RepID=A0A9P4QR48_9PLEO|nr:Aldedh-domain-containing protein [Polyplosphaeria fusca]